MIASMAMAIFSSGGARFASSDALPARGPVGADALRIAWVIVAFCWFSISGLSLAKSQEPEPTAEEKKELLANQRFEEILKKNPRPGTALDRVYEFHIARGSLDDYCSRLAIEAKEMNSGQASLLLGLIQSRRGTDGEARLAFEKAEELLPKEPLASYYLGKTLLLIGDSDAAIQALQRAIDRKPEKADSLQVFQELGRLYQRLRRANEALDVWKRMEAMFPGDLQVQEQIANVLEEEGAHAAALERFTALAAATKDRFRKVELGVRAAALKVKLNQHTEALADFEVLLAQINPGSWLHQDIRRRIDDSFQSRHDTNGLTAYYQRWIDNHPDDVDAMMRIGRLLSIAHNSVAAKDMFRRAIERAPSSVEPRLALVEALERDGSTTEAAAAMQALAEVQPDNPDYLVRWGELLLADYAQPQARRAAAAADVWRKLLDKHASDPVMVSRVADLMRGANLSDEAIKLYKRAIELADSEPQYREYLGEYLHRLGRKDEALAVWRGLASETRKNRDNLVRLSEVLATFAYKEEALTVMGEACQMQPTFAHRLRYAEKLVDATRYADAGEQLKLASQQSASEEEQDQVLKQDIELQMASGEMLKRIDQLETEVAQGTNAKSAAAWKRLALFQEADGKTQPALNSISEALKLAPQSVSILNIAARLQEKSGLIGDAVATLRKLIALDRRGQSRILMQVAAMYVRLGQMEQAIKTAQEMLASADAGTEQYRYYADLCFQSGKIDQGLDALRRNMRSNPNDRDAIELLARALSNHFRTEEAIELTWRSFAKANNQAEKIQSVQTLTELYLRTNAFDDLVKRLDAFGREENRVRESVMLKAAAHQASGDLATARELLEPLLTDDAKDTELLSTLVELARADGDWEGAAQYQTRLNNLSPTPEGGLQLAKFLLESGDVEQAESIWSKYAGQKMSVDDLQNNMRQLLASGETERLLGMIERALKNSPEDWEVLTLCMQMYYRCEKDLQATEIAQKILKFDIARDTLSENAKLQRSRRATSPQTTPAATRNMSVGMPIISVNVDPTATDRVASLNRASQIVQLMNLERTQPMMLSRLGSSAPSVACFGDARYIAMGLKHTTQVDGVRAATLNPSRPNDNLNNEPVDKLATGEASEIARDIGTVTDIDKLWDTALLLSVNEGMPNARNFAMASALARANQLNALNAVGGFGLQNMPLRVGGPGVINDSSPMLPALRRLAELNDHDAEYLLVELALPRFRTARAARQSGRVPSTLEQLDNGYLNEVLELVKKVQAHPGSGQNERLVLLSIYLATELNAQGREKEALSLLPLIKQHARAFPHISYCESLLALDKDTAVDVFLAVMKQSSSAPTNPSSAKLVSSQSLVVSSFLSALLDGPQSIAGLETTSADSELNRSNPLRLITELKKWQAEQARRMRPSQLAAYSPTSPVRFIVRTDNPARGSTVSYIPFPAASALQSSELLVAMYLVHQYPNNPYRAPLDKLLRAEAKQADDDPLQSAIDHLTLSIWLWWSDDHDGAIEELEAVRKTSTVNDLVCMLASRMYFEAGRTKDALVQLEMLKPSTSQLMQERELAILQLAFQIGETDRAKQAAERLFTMRLSPQTQAQVTNLMHRMGMTEMASSMTQRAQRSGANQLSTLVQQLRQLQRENKASAAQEIARQILRRTRPTRRAPGNVAVPQPSTGASNESARRLALQVLAESPEIKQQITQLEDKVKNNPKSMTLSNQLAELYEATGRTAEAEKLLNKPSGNSVAQAGAQGRNANTSAIANRVTQFRQTRSTESVKGYLEIFESHPELIEREFDYFQVAVQQHSGWDAVATRLASWPLERIALFNKNNFVETVIARASPDVSQQLAKKLLEGEDFLTKYGRAFRTRSQKIPWNEEVQSLIVQRVCTALKDPAVLNTKVGQLSGRGTLQTMLTTVDQLIATPDAARKVVEAIAATSDDRTDLKCLEVLMRLTAEDKAGAEKLLDQLRTLPPDQGNMRSLWALASTLTGGPNAILARPLLEQVVKHHVDANHFLLRPVNLLLSNYESTQDFEKAKLLIDQQFAEIQKQPPTASEPLGNNGVQTIVQIGERYLKAGYRLEALAVVSWLKQRSDVLNAVEAMYGGAGNNNPIREQFDRLENLVRNRLDAQAVGVLIDRELSPAVSATNEAANTPQIIMLPVAMLAPEISGAGQNNTKIHCQFRDLLSRLHEDAKVKGKAKETLDALSKSNWSGLKPRNLVGATYLADFLQQKEEYLSAAARLNDLLSEEETALKESNQTKVLEEAKALRSACWMVAEKLVQFEQPELAQAFAKHATALETKSSMNALRMRMRLARTLKDANQNAAAEMHMKELLDQLYPPNAK